MHNRRAFLASTGSAFLAAPAFSFDGTPVKLRDLYNRDGTFSDLINGGEGQRIQVQGFMAPPLKAEAQFFVLTKMPMSVCPFCESAVEWPSDIVAIFTKRTVVPTPFNLRIEVDGVIETGEHYDPDTGFVSMLRLVDAVYS